MNGEITTGKYKLLHALSPVNFLLAHGFSLFFASQVIYSKLNTAEALIYLIFDSWI